MGDVCYSIPNVGFTVQKLWRRASFIVIIVVVFFTTFQTCITFILQGCNHIKTSTKEGEFIISSLVDKNVSNVIAPCTSVKSMRSHQALHGTDQTMLDQGPLSSAFFCGELVGR